MPFRFPSHRLFEIIQAWKVVCPGQRVEFESEGSRGKKLALALEVVNGPLMNLRLLVSCYDATKPESYSASLVLDGERIRGIDYSKIRRFRRYKMHIPKGWHENLIDPNLPTDDDNRNRHLALPDFKPADLKDFLHQVAKRWHTELEVEGLLL
jgi:hypothetical protein